MGNGYLSGNSLIAFPFEDGGMLSWNSGSPDTDNELQVALQKCFSDAGIHVWSETMSATLWPAIGAFSVSAGALSFKIGFGDETSDVGLKIAASKTDKFPIASGSAPWGKYVVVLSSEGIEEFCTLCESKSIYPPAVQHTSSSSGRHGGSWLRICEKCITVQQHGLTSLRVYDGVHPKDDGPHFTCSGDVSIMPGNNMQLLEPSTENGIELNAIPGAGLGRCPCICEDMPGGNSALAGPDGHSRLFNDTCYDVEPGPKYMEYVDGFGREMVTQDLMLHVKCTACCTCDMYEELVQRLSRMAGSPDSEGSLRWARARLDKMYRDYEDSVRKFNARMSTPKLSDITLSLTGMPIGRNVSPKISNVKVSGNMSRCAYTAIFRNESYFDIMIKVDYMSGSDNIVEASASWSDEAGEPMTKSGDNGSAISGTTFTIRPGRSLVITYISTKSGRTGSVSTGGYTGYVSASISYKNKRGATAYLGKLSKAVEV